ncbi:hypothetical protein [Kaistia terrae]|uniref:Uncharacterized protein n=1 Tax=Kaistia terrae TaxID=537017 RepID=A0ABW0Q0E9_9HYPH|nr:hypothetical protein [Kaistia terrae]MCX5578948.1 hypothetical protein [Kaistia terrae]
MLKKTPDAVHADHCPGCYGVCILPELPVSEDFVLIEPTAIIGLWPDRVSRHDERTIGAAAPNAENRNQHGKHDETGRYRDLTKSRSARRDLVNSAIRKLHRRENEDERHC